MAFNFGTSAPSTPGPSFGTGAPAPEFGSSFGPAAAAPAAGGGGFSFGGAAQQPAPAAAGIGFSFGGGNAAPAPAPAFSFAAAPTSAPSVIFGGMPSPAPATAGFSLFGGATSAGGGSTMFGAPPVAAPGGAFGFQPAPAATAPQPPLSGVSGSMPYSSLPPQYKAVIDKIHEAMMTHQRTMINLKSMGPRPLMLATNNNNDNKDNDEALPKMIKNLHCSLNTLQQQVEDAFATAVRQREESGQSIQQTYYYAKWPTEAMASRRGVRLTNPPSRAAATAAEEKKDSTDNSNNNIQEQVREMLNRQMSSVDSIERMPSPYFWQVLDEMQQRTAYLMDQTMQLQNQLSLSRTLNRPNVVTSVRSVVESQDASLAVIHRKLHYIHLEMDKIRQRYKFFERQENVLEKAEFEELQRQNKYDEQIQMQFLRTTATNAASSSSSSAPGAASAGTSSFSTGAFGAAAPSTTAPAPAGTSSFGSTTFGPAPATTTPAPAPGTFTFGAPAPAAGGAPGAAAAPSSTFGFGATAGTATTSFSGFGATTPANKNNKKSSRNKGRLGR